MIQLLGERVILLQWSVNPNKKYILIGISHKTENLKN